MLLMTLLSVKVSIVQPHVNLCQHVTFCQCPTPPESIWCPQMENNLALLEEKAEKNLAAICHEKERLQRRALELRHQLLLQQKHQELVTVLEAQVDLSMVLNYSGHTMEGESGCYHLHSHNSAQAPGVSMVLY